MSITVTNFGDYSVKNVKSFMGREGYGFNANLYRGKKKVAFCMDSANGGMLDIDWVVGKIPAPKDSYPTEDAYSQAWAEYRTANKEEEDLLDNHIATLPPANSDFSEDGLTIDADWFITDCVSKFEEEKDLRKMRKQCVTKTLFRQVNANAGSYQILSVPCDDDVRARLHRDFGEDVEIFNDVLANGGIPSILNVSA